MRDDEGTNKLITDMCRFQLSLSSIVSPRYKHELEQETVILSTVKVRGGQPSSVSITLEARGLDRMQEREFRKLARSFTRKAGQFLLIRQFRIAGCQAPSKADLISRNVLQVMTLFFLLFSIRLVRKRVGVSV